MGTIFATADDVVAWLGPEENNSDVAMAWFQAMAGKVEVVDWRSRTLRPRKCETMKELTTQQRREAEEIDEFIKTRRLRLPIEEARSVYFVFMRAFFERAWIAQEIRLARRVLFQCGPKILPEDNFWTALACLVYDIEIPVDITKRKDWHEACQHIWFLANTRTQNERESVYTIRNNLGHLICNDPRDKIYSALGIMDSSTQSLQIIPSYNQAVEQVYGDVAQRVITQWSDLTVLENCELSSRILEIPSWVPDWSTPTKSHYLRTNSSACAYVASLPSFSCDSLRCTVPGIYIDLINEVREPALIKDSFGVQELFVYTRSLRPAMEDLSRTYLTGEVLMEVYCRVLICNQFSAGHGEASPDYLASLKLLEAIWSGQGSVRGLEFLKDVISPISYIRGVNLYLYSRTLFETSSGHLGLAPSGTRVGDVLCVLLGCDFPVILRPAGDHTYQVIGTCYAHGLMNGEAIYRNTHVAKEQREKSGHDPYYGSFSPKFEDLSIDPVDMLQQLDIEVESEQDDPYRIFVGLETLRDAGIPLEDFTLI